jgi:hypothetical protein
LTNGQRRDEPATLTPLPSATVVLSAMIAAIVNGASQQVHNGRRWPTCRVSVEESVRLPEEGQHQVAFAVPSIVAAAGAVLHMVAGAADAQVSGEPAFEDEGLLDCNVFVVRKASARRLRRSARGCPC